MLDEVESAVAEKRCLVQLAVFGQLEDDILSDEYSVPVLMRRQGLMVLCERAARQIGRDTLP